MAVPDPRPPRAPVVVDCRALAADLEAIERGDERCDYAPGAWRLQIDAELRLDGSVLPRVDVADIALDLPLEPVGTVLPFHPNSETRPCSYIAAVFTRQGEPLFEPE